MIASFSKNFIYIRTRKTASTSTEIVLGSWCGPEDIVTPVGVDDELTRLDYGGSPRNFATDRELEAAYRRSLPTADRKAIAVLYKRIMQALHFHHHMSALEVRSMVEPAFWDSAFKFTVERHPYEKVVSLTYWRNRQRDLAGRELSRALDEMIDGAEFRNFDLYAAEGKPIVDKVLRYEKLSEELAAVAKRMGEALPPVLPLSKGHYRKDRSPASQLLSDAQKARVREICREEFELMGYDPT